MTIEEVIQKIEYEVYVNFTLPYIVNECNFRNISISKNRQITEQRLIKAMVSEYVKNNNL